MAAVVIRDADADDAPRLLPLLASLGYPADAAAVKLRLQALRAGDPTGRVLVAVAGSELLGFATVHCTPTLHRPTAVGRITGLAVAGGWSGHGVGRRLVEAAEAHCAALGISRMEVTSGPTHAPAYGFYRHLGYVDQGLRFAKALGAPPSG